MTRPKEKGCYILLAMAPVAEGGVPCAFAGAKEMGSTLLGLKNLGAKLRPFVGTIAKRLIGRFPAGTKGVGLALF